MRLLRIAGVIAINVAVLLALLGATIVVTMISKSHWFDSIDIVPNVRGGVPNYRSIAWARQHFYEWERLRVTYQPTVAWRREPVAGRTITVEGPYGERRTARPSVPTGKSVYFFGGSTMWGTGADDDGTIPSWMAREFGIQARNFGESGYTAHQGLSTLIRLVQEGHRPDVAVFYDGVNDVAVKCRTDSGTFSLSNEAELRRNLDTPAGSLLYFMRPFLDLVGFRQNTVRRSDCVSSPAKAQAVAEALIQDWRMARMVAEMHGIRLIAILQPVMYVGHARTDHLPDWRRNALGRQYRAVYPIVLELLKDAGFHSLVHVLDADDYFYVDFCHLSPNGNAVVARAIAPLLD